MTNKPLVTRSDKRERRLKAVVMLLSVVISLLIGEVALRWLTVFPISRDSNIIDDPRLGYRMSPSFPDIDRDGFRNPEGARQSYEVAAIGDSHTYGHHVDAEYAWPVVLSELSGLSTFNFGVNSYNIFSYHALVDAAIEDGARAIIIGLYPTNDFTGTGLICGEGADSDYWFQQVTALQLDAPRSPAECLPGNRREPGGKSLDEYLSMSAIFSAVNHLILKRVTELSRRSGLMSDLTFFLHNIPYTFGIPVDGVVEDQFFRFPGNVLPLSKTRVPHVSPSEIEMLENFRKMATSWRVRTAEKDIKLGILIIPERSQVVYSYLRQQEMLDSVDPAFREIVESLNAFDRSIQGILDEIGIPWAEAAPVVAVAMGEATAAGRNFYPAMDGHPLEDGYRAYGVAALRLLESLLERSTPAGPPANEAAVAH